MKAGDRRLALAVGSFLIGALALASSLFVPITEPPPPAFDDIGAPALPDASPIQIFNIADMAEFTARPLFHADRQPFRAPEPQPVEVVHQVATPGFSLAGTMGTADGPRWAYVATENGVVRVGVGESIEDWAVTGVEEDRVLIQRETEEFQIVREGTEPLGASVSNGAGQGATNERSARTRLRRNPRN